MSVYSVFGKQFNHFWQVFNAIGLNFIAVNGQILKKILSSGHTACDQIQCKQLEWPGPNLLKKISSFMLDFLHLFKQPDWLKTNWAANQNA